MKTYRFEFTIDAPKYAARFGVDIPDDSADELTDDGAEIVAGGSNDSAVVGKAEDADVTMGAQMTRHSSLYGQCAATLAQCRAKNPMTCRYHGALAIANDVESVLRAAGVTGKVSCELMNVVGNKLSVSASVVAPESEEDKVVAAMKNFMALPGVDGDAENFMADDETGEVSGDFEIDMLDAGAKARWGVGQQPPQTVQQSVVQPTVTTTAQPVTAPPKKTRTRKRTNVANVAPIAVSETVQPQVAESPKEEKRLGDDAPVLFPGVPPPKPPEWNPPFTQPELNDLGRYAERIGKTAETIDKHLDAGDMEQYLQKKGGNGVLPDRLQKYKRQIDLVTLRVLAAKDTAGQVQKLVDAAEKIDASEANGWMDRIGLTKRDLEFDASKYNDPYGKERAAYEAYIPDSDGRKWKLDSLKQVEESKSGDAPKEAAKRCRAAAKEMDDLEDDYNTAKSGNAPDAIMRMLGQAYYAANAEFEVAAKECQKWMAKQSVMQDTIDATIAAMKDRGLEVPEEMMMWQHVEDKYEDTAWKEVAQTLGLNVADKAKHLSFYKKNMKAYLTRCPVISYYHANHVKTLIRGASALHANNNSYVPGANAAFGTKWNKHDSKSAKGMHVYAKVHSCPLSELAEASNYQGCSGGVGILFNPKTAIISYVNAYLSSASAITPHYNSCSPTFAHNPNCNGVSLSRRSSYGGDIGEISKSAFTKDISGMPMRKLHQEMGLGTDGGEAWGVGGLTAKQIVAIKDYHNSYSKAGIKKFNELGITILNSQGKVVGSDLITDPELRMLTFGK